MKDAPVIPCLKTYWHISKVAEYKINIEKWIVFLYSSNEKNEENCSIYNSTKKNIILINLQKTFYTQHYKILIEKMKDVDKWKDIPC